MDDEILTIEEAARKLAHEHVDGLSPEHLERLAGTVASWEDDFAAHVWHTHQEYAAFCEKQHHLKNKDLGTGKTPDFALPAMPAPLPIKPPPPWLHKSNAEEVESGRRMALWAYSAKDFAKRLLQSIGNGTLTTRNAATGGSIDCSAFSTNSFVSLVEARECLHAQHRISFPKPTLPPLAQQQEQEQTEKAVTIRTKLRNNVLDTPIEKAIQQAKSLETSAVFLKLKELALAGEQPFTGLVDGPALLYTDDNTNKVKGLTKAGLEKRLKHYRP